MLIRSQDGRTMLDTATGIGYRVGRDTDRYGKSRDFIWAGVGNGGRWTLGIYADEADAMRELEAIRYSIQHEAAEHQVGKGDAS